MSFRIQSGHNQRIIDDLVKKNHTTKIVECASTKPIITNKIITEYFSAHDKNDLKSNDEQNYLSTARISNFDHYPIMYQNQMTKESFVIDWYDVNVIYKGFIKDYQYYDENKRQFQIIDDYVFQSNMNGVVALSIKDILKYYYFANRDLPDFGLDNIDKNDLKDYKELFLMATEDISITVDIKKVFGYLSKNTLCIYKTKTDKIIWNNTSYLGSLILCTPKNLGNMEIVKSILNLYINDISFTVLKDIIYYDPPVPLEQVYREHEYMDPNDPYSKENRTTYKELTRPLKPSEAQLIDNYSEFIIDPSFIGKINGCQNSFDSDKTMNYPTFAYRKFLVSKWIPGMSYCINYKMQIALKTKKYDKLKNIQNKRGKLITEGKNRRTDYKLKDIWFLNYRRGDIKARKQHLASLANESLDYYVKESFKNAQNHSYDDDYIDEYDYTLDDPMYEYNLQTPPYHPSEDEDSSVSDVSSVKDDYVEDTKLINEYDFCE